MPRCSSKPHRCIPIIIVHHPEPHEHLLLPLTKRSNQLRSPYVHQHKPHHSMMPYTDTQTHPIYDKTHLELSLPLSSRYKNKEKGRKNLTDSNYIQIHLPKKNGRIEWLYHKPNQQNAEGKPASKQGEGDRTKNENSLSLIRFLLLLNIRSTRTSILLITFPINHLLTMRRTKTIFHKILIENFVIK